MVDMAIKQIITTDLRELSRKGEELYQSKLKDSLEKAHRGEFVAIEAESGDYFIDKTQIDAWQLAKKKHPDKLFYFVRVGFPAVETHAFIRPFSAYGLLF